MATADAMANLKTVSLTETGVISPGGIGFDINCLVKENKAIFDELEEEVKERIEDALEFD